ncbi:MAG: hypothetical protein EBR67_09965, partial [Proteobacteria bacterium]|nr:hypothetical protein [Pseudomonadota bacterium]
MSNFNFSKPVFNTSNGVYFSPGGSAPQNQQEFEANCGEGEHILAIQLYPAKHWQMQEGKGYTANGTRESTYLTFTAGSVMVSQQGPFLKGLVLVGCYLYKKGSYLQPPAYTSDSSGHWGIHPEASLNGLAKLIHGEFAEETLKLLQIYSSRIDEIVALSNLSQNFVEIIDRVEGCMQTGDFSSFTPQGVTAENAEAYIENIQQQQQFFLANKENLEEEYNHCVNQCKELIALRQNTNYWKELCQNTQGSINLTGLNNDNIVNTFESLKDSNEGRILKMRCIL